MPSNALLRWQRDARAELDDIADAHTAVGGTGRARRVATVQINHAYAVLLSSQFQRFCRDLHTESIEQMCAAVPTVWTRPILRRADLWLSDVRGWRSACDGLADTIDAVLCDHLGGLAGRPPW